MGFASVARSARRVLQAGRVWRARHLRTRLSARQRGRRSAALRYASAPMRATHRLLRLDPLLAVGLLAGFAVLAVHAWSYRFLTDDAFISFRYARNLADGYG